jgi:hypothetical protein
MPPALGAGEVVLRSAPEVLNRALALICVAVHAEGIKIGEPDIRPRLREANPIGMASLTPQETAFTEAETPDANTALQMGWRYEALNLLLWALGHEAGQIDRSDVLADAAPLARAMLELAQEPATEPSLRPTADILEALDRTWREHWIVREASKAGKQPDGLDPGVILERHVALNWLTGFQNEPGTDWDDIDTPS